jgi:hypothetical protein
MGRSASRELADAACRVPSIERSLFATRLYLHAARPSLPRPAACRFGHMHRADPADALRAGPVHRGQRLTEAASVRARTGLTAAQVVASLFEVDGSEIPKEARGAVSNEHESRSPSGRTRAGHARARFEAGRPRRAFQWFAGLPAQHCAFRGSRVWSRPTRGSRRFSKRCDGWPRRDAGLAVLARHGLDERPVDGRSIPNRHCCRRELGESTAFGCWFQ